MTCIHFTPLRVQRGSIRFTAILLSSSLLNLPESPIWYSFLRVLQSFRSFLPNEILPPHPKKSWLQPFMSPQVGRHFVRTFPTYCHISRKLDRGIENGLQNRIPGVYKVLFPGAFLPRTWPAWGYIRASKDSRKAKACLHWKFMGTKHKTWLFHNFAKDELCLRSLW